MLIAGVDHVKLVLKPIEPDPLFPESTADKRRG